MKKSKKFLSLILAVILAFGTFSISFSALAQGGIDTLPPIIENNDNNGGIEVLPPIIEDGDVKPFEPTVGWNLIDGEWYYYDENLNMLTDSWAMDSVGWCYLGSDGKMVTNAWQADSIGWAYLGEDGRMVKSGWLLVDGDWYIMDADGYCLISQWFYYNNDWYYMNSTGRMATDCWIADSIGWLYLTQNGTPLKDSWIKDYYDWCYVNSYGYMVYNEWHTDSKGWCYIASNGYIYRSGWLAINGYWYYLDTNGTMQTGWIYLGNAWYYLYEDGTMAANTWIDGCYVDYSGAYYEDEPISDDIIISIENMFLQYINEDRANNGRTKLYNNNYLYDCANQRSYEISELFSHTRPNGNDCFTIVDENIYPYYTLGENIGYLSYNNFSATNSDIINDIAENFFIAFKNSPPHYENILTPEFDETGVAIYYTKTGNVTTFYMTQIFGSQQ